jgi:uncharacterized protein YjiK
MTMRKRIFIALLSNLLGAVALVLVLAWAVGAQGPEPGERERYRGPHPVQPTGVRLSEKPALRPAALGDLGAQDVSAAVTVGQPGTVFRYEDTFGETEVPYTSTTTHLNQPYALAVDGADNVYVAEGEGHRVLKYDSAGNYQNLQIGYTGLCRAWDDWDTGLCGPGGLAVDSGGNIWVAERWPDRVSVFTPTGTYTGQLGVTWEDGSDNDHFDEPEGVAFDSAGRIYVADRDNDRVQILDSTRTYSATIGGTCGTGDYELCRPHGLAIGSGDVLHVADSDNARVQVYQLVGDSMVFSQSITTTGTTDFAWVPGVAVNANYLYVADMSNNGQVHVFSRSGVYSSTIAGDCFGSNDWFCWPMDVAVDSAGNVYVTDTWAHSRVMKCSGGPTWTCTSFAGTKDVPYPTDDSHFNGPAGIAVGASLFVVEEPGQRLLKLNDSGVPQWNVGEAGVWGSDNDHFDWPGGVAVDSNGRMYVPDANNHRVQIFNSDGSYYTTLGNADCNPDNGIGNAEFCWPKGVAIGPGDAIYVADTDNHRVQIFNSDRIYQNTLGATGVSGSDNGHFDGPMGVTVDSSGNIYVADAWNHRVQVFNSSLVHQMTLGTTGEWGDDFDHFSDPHDVAVDASGRIYVADRWNNRLQVFDSNGAYLTTIGGSWGSNTGQLRNPWGIDVDSAGNVYVADSDNSRIQKFTRGVPGWEQVNINGFGHPSNPGVLSLASFKGYLYAGVDNRSGDGNRLWRKSDSEPWTAVITTSFGLSYSHGIDHLIEFNDQLYAGTKNWNWNVWATEGGEIWRSSDGLSWTRVISQGFGDPTNGEVFHFDVFSDTLYASTWSYTDTHGTEIWHSSSGDSDDWTRVVANGFGDADNECALGFEVFNGYLYAGTFNWDTGGEIWRTPDGTNWTQVNTDGFGDYDNDAIASFAVFNGYLYAGTMHDSTGGQVWRCLDASGCDEDSDWEQVVGDGFGSTDNRSATALIVSDNYLYCVTSNDETGAEVWRTNDGTNWEQVSPDGFGDSNNQGPYWDNSVLDGSLYIGTWNWANGGEVWQLAEQVYLPIILKSYP